MEAIAFDKLLIKTAFCCMASDGNIDNREISLINSMCEKSTSLKDINFHEEINSLITELNTKGKDFLSNYFNLLKVSSLTEEEELTLIDFAIKTIKADEKIEYSEIKFFKVIRRNLKVSNEKILDVYPDIEQFVEEDIITESYLEKITNQYLDTDAFPQFKLISLQEIEEFKKSSNNK